MSKAQADVTNRLIVQRADGFQFVFRLSESGGAAEALHLGLNQVLEFKRP